MFDRLRRAVLALEQGLRGLDPDTLHLDDAPDVLRLFSRGEKLCAAGKALVAERVASSGSWKAEVDRSPAHFAARTTGDSVGAAVTAIETARRMADLPKHPMPLGPGNSPKPRRLRLPPPRRLRPMQRSSCLRWLALRGLPG